MPMDQPAIEPDTLPAGPDTAGHATFSSDEEQEDELSYVMVDEHTETPHAEEDTAGQRSAEDNATSQLERCERGSEEHAANQQVQDTVDECMLFITKHLIHYLEAPPDEQAGESEASEVTYEGWIGTLHPENCGVSIGLEPGAIDSRFYATSSKHRELWNTHCHKHWSPSAQPVESRSLSAWAPSKRDNAFAPAMDMLDEAAAKAEAAAKEAAAATGAGMAADADADADADSGSGALGDSTSFEEGGPTSSVFSTESTLEANTERGTLRAAGPRANTWPSTSESTPQTTPVAKWRAPSAASLLAVAMVMFLALAAALTMRVNPTTEPKYGVSTEPTGSESKRRGHQWWRGGTADSMIANAPVAATETPTEASGASTTLVKSAAVKIKTKVKAEAKAKAEAEAEANAHAKALKAEAEAELWTRSLTTAREAKDKAKAEVKARALAAAEEAKAAKMAEVKARKAAKNMDKTSEKRGADGAGGAEGAGGAGGAETAETAGGEALRADAASGLALASYLPDAGSMTGRLVISAALGVAGLGVGVPYVPGLVDNVIVGGLAAAAPFYNESWTAVKRGMAEVPEMSRQAYNQSVVIWDQLASAVSGKQFDWIGEATDESGRELAPYQVSTLIPQETK
mmetsp:Transcript_6536/g.13336  ORF Transcript_6536/g.13336 Transcript_6536/m.13336 type:complete len:631 (-) Transcript_6536:96-1988(-)